MMLLHPMLLAHVEESDAGEPLPVEDMAGNLEAMDWDSAIREIIGHHNRPVRDSKGKEAKS